MDFPHYSELARFPWSECVPYNGAYCARIKCGDTNDHTVTEGDIDIADAGTAYVSFMLYFAPNFTATADDVFNLFEFQQAAGTIEASIGCRITAATGAIEIGVGDGIAPSDYSAQTLDRNKWYHIECAMKVSTGGVGTLTLYVDGVSKVALTSLTNAAAVGQGVFGTQNTLATTTGTILLDQFICDDGQLYPQRVRYPQSVTITQSGHVFVGPGAIDVAAILSTGSDNTMKLYDTDTGNTNDAQGLVADLSIAGHTSIEGLLAFQRGCYVSLGGTSPRGQVILTSNDNVGGTLGPRYYTSAMIRRYGQMRRERRGNV